MQHILGGVYYNVCHQSAQIGHPIMGFHPIARGVITKAMDITWQHLCQLANKMCSCGKCLYNPHHYTWVFEMYVTIIQQSKHKVNAH